MHAEREKREKEFEKFRSDHRDKSEVSKYAIQNTQIKHLT